MKTDAEVFADQQDGDWDGPSKSDAQAAVKRLNRALEIARRAEEVATWRERNPEATCSDFVAGTLTDLEATFAAKDRAS